MNIGFNQIPANNRLPFVFVEFNNTNAIQGTGLKAYKALMLGQKLSTGSAVADAPVRLTSTAQAKSLFGDGSMLHHMAEKWFLNNKTTELWVIPQADNASGTKATGTLTFTGPASGAGAINLYIAGRKLSVAVANGDSVTAIAAAVAAAINALPYLGVTAAAALGVVTLSYAHKGLVGNEVDVRANYYDGEALPSGVGLTIVAFSGGTLNPSLTAAISAMGEVQYDVIACAYNEAASLADLETELTSRFGPTRQIDGVLVIAKNADFATITAFGASRNSPHVSLQHCYKHPSHSAQFAASVASVMAFYGNIDPARPFQTLAIAGELAPVEADRFTNEERNLMLYDAVSTNSVDSGGVLRLERMITMYQQNGLGADDVSYLDVTSMLTLSFLRYDFRNYFLLKYPRHKLANDGTRYGAGQPVMTPALGKAEAIAKFRDWEELGLVENFEDFKANLIVERNLGDVNRLDFLLPPNLINQLITTAAQIDFRL